MAMPTLGILGSGAGSNMQAILDAIGEGRLAAKITVVFSDNPDAYILERARENGIRAEVIDCAPHRMKFPDTYRALKYCEIRHDYTMIHSPLPGFRAGICTPHKWYDIPREEETGLTIHPSTVMEGTLRDYMKLSPADGFQVIEQLMADVKAVGGTFISIWHNDSFSEENKEWIGVYEGMLKLAN